MAQSHVVSGLVSKRSELAGILEGYQKEVRRIGIEISALDTSIKIFDPSYKIQSIKSTKKYKTNPHFANGELHRLIQEVMRDAGQPIATPDISEQVISRKGLTLDAEALGSVKAAVSNALSRQKAKGMISEAGKEGMAIIWGQVV